MKNRFTKSILVTSFTLGLATAAHAAVYSQTFTYPDGTGDLADGSTLTNNAPTGVPATVQGNALLLTSTANFNTQNSYNIPALANSSLGFTVTFDITLADAAGGNPPADGFSFNYGNFGSSANYGEEGPFGVGTQGLSWVVDTWDNLQGDQGIRSKINGVNDFVQNFAPLAPDQTISTSVSLSWDPTNGMSLNIGALGQVFSNRPTGAFVPSDAFIFGIGARTGNATETVLIDNLVITTVPESTSAMLAGMAGLGLLSMRRRN
jgi:hypothetical protein